MYLSEGFCRNIITHTLLPQLYLKDNLVDLANLSAHFLASCDKHGEINLLASPPSEILFQRDKKEVAALRNCKINANEETWFGECVEICNNFKLFEYPIFFESHL